MPTTPNCAFCPCTPTAPLVLPPPPAPSPITPKVSCQRRTRRLPRGAVRARLTDDAVECAAHPSARATDLRPITPAPAIDPARNAYSAENEPMVGVPPAVFRDRRAAWRYWRRYRRIRREDERPLRARATGGPHRWLASLATIPATTAPATARMPRRFTVCVACRSLPMALPPIRFVRNPRAVIPTPVQRRTVLRFLAARRRAVSRAL